MAGGKERIVLIFYVFLWGVSIPLACLPGPMPIDVHTVIHLLLAFFSPELLPEADMTAYVVVTQIRLARVILALFCGGALAVAGVVLQGVLRNALADPFTLGISAGAACGASIALTLSASTLAFMTSLVGANFVYMVGGLTTIFAFAGSLLALLMAMLLGSGFGQVQMQSSGARENIILAGIAVSTFLGAFVALIKALHEESVTSIVFWIMGSFQGRTWDALPLILLPLILGVMGIAMYWRELDVLSLGQRQAAQLGVSVAKVRIILLVSASCITAGCVAVAGVIAFVGLVVPHILRMCFSFLGQKSVGHGMLLTSAFFGGGLLLVWADVLARSLLSDGQELPVGVVTSLLGGPFFALLIWQRHK